MHLKPMDPEHIRKLLEGVEDVLTPAAEAEAELYANIKCPMCEHKGCQKRIPVPKSVVTDDGEVMIQSPWGDGLLPDGYAHCPHCGTDFNPFTGLIHETEASMIHGPE